MSETKFIVVLEVFKSQKDFSGFRVKVFDVRAPDQIFSE